MKVYGLKDGQFLINHYWIDGSVILFPQRFYMWNVVATMLLLQVMSFAAYALDPIDIEGLSGRIGLTVTLVLTCGIYRSANAQFSPPVATLTLLDEYVLLTSFIIGATLLTHALVSVERYAWLEPLFIQGHVVVMVLQHLYSFCIRTAGAAKMIFSGRPS